MSSYATSNTIEFFKDANCTDKIATWTETDGKFNVSYGDTECFRLMRYDIERSCRIEPNGRFCGLYFLGGKGSLCSASGAVSVKGGDQFFVPASSEAFDITSTGCGKLTVFRCFGPKL